VYEIYLERGAEKNLKKLQAEEFQRIINKVKDLADNPRPFKNLLVCYSPDDRLKLALS
jgi:mRNA-degrading endonuclease RelE of RelBE toxin-antitoxin system